MATFSDSKFSNRNRGWMQKFINILFPENCLYCKKVGPTLCEDCFSKIPKKYFENENIFSIYEFKNEVVNKLIWRLKYHHTESVVKNFGSELAKEIVEFLKNTNRQNVDICIIPIPLNKGDKRLYNHAEIISNYVKIYLEKFTTNKVYILPNILQKNTKMKQAHTKSKLERFENVKDSFYISSSPFSISQEEVPKKERVFIVVDDVFTSGATINEARRVLQKHLGLKTKEEILAFTIAH